MLICLAATFIVAREERSLTYGLIDAYTIQFSSFVTVKYSNGFNGLAMPISYPTCTAEGAWY